MTTAGDCIAVLELPTGAVRGLALRRHPTPTGLSPFFPLLFITALGPRPAWLPPAISSYRCSGSQPWALWGQSPLGPSTQGVEDGRACRSTAEDRRPCQAELVWPVFIPFSADSGGSGGPEWAEVGDQEGMCCLLPALPVTHLTAQPHLTPGHLYP